MLKNIGLILLVVMLAALAGCSTAQPTTTTSATTAAPSVGATPVPAAVTNTAPPSTTASAASVAPVTSTPPTTPKALVSIKVGSLPRIYDIIAFAAQQEHLFEKHGVNAEIISFRSETEKDNAMFAGQLDGVIEGTFGAINLNKNEETSKLVGHNLMPRMFELVVTPASGITEASQLKGKDVATSTGTIMEFAVDNLLATKGVAMKDVNIINVPSMPLRLEMLTQGKIAAALFTSPLSDQAVAAGDIKLIDDSQVQYGGPGLIFSTEALKNKSEAINGFIQAWQEAVRMLNANPEKYRQLIIATAKVPDVLAASYKIPVFPELRLPSQAEVDKINNWMITQGWIKQAVQYEKAIESKYLK